MPNLETSNSILKCGVHGFNKAHKTFGPKLITPANRSGRGLCLSRATQAETLSDQPILLGLERYRNIW